MKTAVFCFLYPPGIQKVGCVSKIVPPAFKTVVPSLLAMHHRLQWFKQLRAQGLSTPPVPLLGYDSVSCSFVQDEVDHKDIDDEDHVDLVKKAEQEFFECIEAEKSRRERSIEGKDQLDADDNEKHDRGKVRSLLIISILLVHITRHQPSASSARCGLFVHFCTFCFQSCLYYFFRVPCDRLGWFLLGQLSLSSLCGRWIEYQF